MRATKQPASCTISRDTTWPRRQIDRAEVFELRDHPPTRNPTGRGPGRRTPAIVSARRTTRESARSTIPTLSTTGLRSICATRRSAASGRSRIPRRAPPGRLRLRFVNLYALGSAPRSGAAHGGSLAHPLGFAHRGRRIAGCEPVLGSFPSGAGRDQNREAGRGENAPSGPPPHLPRDGAARASGCGFRLSGGNGGAR